MPALVTEADGRAYEELLSSRFGIRLPDSDGFYTARPYLAEAGDLSVSLEFIDLREVENADRRNQVVQHLRDLGYLDEEEKSPSDARLGDALSTFCREAELFLEFFQVKKGSVVDPTAPSERATGPIKAQRDPLCLESDMLRMLVDLTSFEGSLRLAGLPQVNEVGLRSRVMHFRLLTYNLVPSRALNEPDGLGPANPVSTDSLEALGAASDLLGDHGTQDRLSDSDLIAALDLLGDAEALYEQYERSYGGRRLLVKADRNMGNGTGESKRRPFARLSKQRKHPEDVAKTETIHPTEESSNLLGLELLQIFLWMQDYYLGEIDADWGSESMNALNRCIAFENLKGRKIIKKRGSIKEIDFARVIQALRKAAGAPKGISETQDRALTGMEAALRKEKIESWQGLEKRITNRNRAQMNRRRRRYFGFGSFLHAIRKIARNAASWIKRALKRLFGPVLKFLRFIGCGLKFALRIAGLGIRRLYLLISGKPFLSGQTNPPRLVATFSRLEGDTQTIACTQGEATMVIEHFRKIRAMNQALEWLLIIGIKALEILSGNPLAWLKNAIDIFKFVRDQLQEKRIPVFQAVMPGT